MITYTIMCEDDYLYSTSMPEYKLESASLTLELNGVGMLNFGIPKGHPSYNSPVLLGKIVRCYRNDKPIFRGRIVKIESNIYESKMVTCESDLAFLNDSIQRPYDFMGENHTTPEALFRYFIEKHNEQVSEKQQFKVGEVTVTDPNNYIVRANSDYSNTLEGIKSKLLNSPLGGFLITREESDGVYIDYLSEITSANPQRVELKKNVISLNDLTEIDNFATVVIPLGAKIKEENGEEKEERLTIESVNDGKDYLLSDLANIYGKISKPVVFDDVTDANNLLRKGKDTLVDLTTFSKTFDISAADLSAVEDVEAFSVGKQTYVIVNDKEELLLCSALNIDILNPVNFTLQIGKKWRGLSDNTQDFMASVGNVVDKVETISKNTVIATNNAKQAIAELESFSSTVSQTAEEITLGIVSNYVKTTELEAVHTELKNLLQADVDGFNFQFETIKQKVSELGDEVVKRKSWIDLVNGEIIIGKSDSPVTSVYTNNALIFKYDGKEVAKFTSDSLWVRNVEVDNQVQYFEKWAMRKGAYQANKGNNLNIVWIGG